MSDKSAYFNKHSKIEAQYFKKDDCKVQGQGQGQGQGIELYRMMSHHSL